MHYRTTAFLTSIALTCSVASAAAQLRAELVAEGLSRPVAFAQDPSNPQIQLIGEQGGRIRVLVNGALQTADFLNLTGVVTPGGGERGLFGIAFAPDFATSGRVFVSFTDVNGNSVLARFVRASSAPLVGDPDSRFDLRWPGGLAWIAQPFANHNGGHIVFGPDGYLYYGMGDGGSGNDPFHFAQDPTSLLGKMLRLDVSVPDSDPEGYNVPAANPFLPQPGVLPEIWAFGLRNPWRFHFDEPTLGGTGALLIADVGQNAWEEVNYEPALGGGRNYGWRNREGAHDNVTSLPAFLSPLSDPIFEYGHDQGGSITGGAIYRGNALGAAHVGRYFFADYVTSRVWSIGLTIGGGGEATAIDVQEHTSELADAAANISSFGVDSAGELYVLSHSSGRVYRIGLNGIGCAPPDPFLAIGGGTCSGGNWYPPGYPVPGTPPPSGGTPPPAPPSGAGCSTPDPFATLGGGTCADGNWYPPGYPLPSTPPSSGGTPPPTSPPSGTGCSTPDPFATLGGGSCVNGEWLPPGYPGAPAPPPPPPTPAPSPGGCTTPDPFEVLGGGSCIDGNWLPPGYPSAGGFPLRPSTAGLPMRPDLGDPVYRLQI